MWNPFSLVVFVLLAGATCAHAQESGAQYPSKPIRIIVPYAAGGGADAAARLVGKHLNEAWQQPVVVENRAGADGRVGTEAVIRSAADGYTLLVSPENQFTIIPHLFPNATVNAVRDLEPVVSVARGPLVLVVNSNVAAYSLADLIRVAKASPGALTYGTSGNGSIHRMAAESMSRMAGIEMLHVPYKGTSASAQDLAGGQLQVLFGQLPAIQPLVKAGKARILAVTSSQRFSMLPDTPSISETLPGWVELGTSFGVLVPKGTPQPIVDKLNAEVGKGVQSADVRERLAASGMIPGGGTQAQYRAEMQRIYDIVGKIIRDAHIKAE